MAEFILQLKPNDLPLENDALWIFVRIALFLIFFLLSSGVAYVLANIFLSPNREGKRIYTLGGGTQRLPRSKDERFIPWLLIVVCFVASAALCQKVASSIKQDALKIVQDRERARQAEEYRLDQEKRQQDPVYRLEKKLEEFSGLVQDLRQRVRKTFTLAEDYQDSIIKITDHLKKAVVDNGMTSIDQLNSDPEYQQLIQLLKSKSAYLAKTQQKLRQASKAKKDAEVIYEKISDELKYARVFSSKDVDDLIKKIDNIMRNNASEKQSIGDIAEEAISDQEVWSLLTADLVNTGN